MDEWCKPLVRGKLSQRLHTTVEEEVSVKDNFEQVLAREKRAGKERLVRRCRLPMTPMLKPPGIKRLKL